MNNKTIVFLGMIAVLGNANASIAANIPIKAKLIINNVHGVVSEGSWFNLELQNSIVPEDGSQSFTAKTSVPIFNKDFSEGLITAKAVVNGTYYNDGKTCSFNIENISFGDTEIEFLSGALSVVNASQPNQPDCNPMIGYEQNQALEFQTKVDIENLDPIWNNKEFIIKNSQDDFAQTYGNSDYAIGSIVKYTNGLMKVRVKFNSSSIKDKLVPVYFDDFGVSHALNFNLVSDKTQLNNSYSYIFAGTHRKFGFGILE